MSDLQRLFHLRGGIGEHLSVAACGRAMEVARMRKEICRSPEELDSGSFLFVLERTGHRVEIAVCLAQGISFRSDVSVMKTIDATLQVLTAFVPGINAREVNGCDCKCRSLPGGFNPKRHSTAAFQNLSDSPNALKTPLGFGVRQCCAALDSSFD